MFFKQFKNKLILWFEHNNSSLDGAQLTVS